MIVLEDTNASEKKSLLELKAKKKPPTVAAPVPGQQAPSTPAPRSRDTDMGGTEAAAGVLNAVDEDIEGGAEADCPDEFDVESEDDME